MSLALSQISKGYSAYAITLSDFLQPPDERKIMQLFESMKKAWDKGNAILFGACFTEDSDFVSFRGDHYKGRQSNVEKHEKLFATALKDSKLFVTIKNIRFVNDNMAVVHAEGAALQSWEQESACGTLSYTTAILVKEKGEWKITSFHNSKKKQPGLFERIGMWFRSW